MKSGFFRVPWGGPRKGFPQKKTPISKKHDPTPWKSQNPQKPQKTPFLPPPKKVGPDAQKQP